MVHLQHQKKLTPFLSNALKCICFSSPVGRNEPSALCCRAPRAHPCSASTDGCTQPSPTSAANHPSASPPKSYPSCVRRRGPRGVPPLRIRAGQLADLTHEIPTFPRAHPRAAEAAPLQRSTIISQSFLSRTFFLREKHSHSSQYTFTRSMTVKKTTLIAAMIHPPVAGDVWHASRSIWQRRRGEGLSTNASQAATFSHRKDTQRVPLTWRFSQALGSILQNPPTSHSLQRVEI